MKGSIPFWCTTSRLLCGSSANWVACRVSYILVRYQRDFHITYRFLSIAKPVIFKSIFCFVNNVNVCCNIFCTEHTIYEHHLAILLTDTLHWFTKRCNNNNNCNYLGQTRIWHCKYTTDVHQRYTKMHHSWTNPLARQMDKLIYITNLLEDISWTNL